MIARWVTRYVIPVLAACALATNLVQGAETIIIDRPMSPPTWALLQRELLRANTAACKEFFAKYFDDHGWLLCVERWGGDDGPDDATENCNDWPLLHALGAPDVVRKMYEKAWEGHLRQYTQAKTKEVPLAREGMYYKEFPVMFDWMHHGEGLTVFHLMGLSSPGGSRYVERARRYAGFYMNEDPGALNYDPQLKIIRSFFNGSRGPLLRKATALDWAGDPIEIEHRFRPLHGERSYQEMLAHFKDYTETLGDHPQNLRATSLALTAYMLSHEEKYKKWILEYVDAWRQRTVDNGNIIPSNVGRDGKVGGDAGGKWYGGTYGWGFTVVVPQTGQRADRNRTMYGFAGFLNAFLLTADDKYLDTWRTMMDTINAQARAIDGRTMYPRMFGDQGWYCWTPQPYAENALEVWCLSMKPEDRRRVPADPWIDFLEGRNPTYPEQALRADLSRVQERAAAMRKDPTTPDSRLADDPMQYNPASVSSLVRLMLGGIPPGVGGAVLLARLRYFDPVANRAGVPEEVASLVDQISSDAATVTLVNLDQVYPRTVIVQAGACAEHTFTSVKLAGATAARALDQSWLRVKLEPGCGATLQLTMRRHVNRPTLAFPWDR
ncbi:MAG: hypothetical protein WD468_07450 [Pirellulales bacterium]